MPPREVLLARLAGGFQAPLVKAAGLFQAFTRNFAYGLKAYIDIRPDDESRVRDATASRTGGGEPPGAGARERTRANPTMRRRRSETARDRAAIRTRRKPDQTEATTGEAN